MARPTGERGAVVLGGDYVGLGVVRSLGRRGVPVWVIDDERSIARFSRYAMGGTRIDSLRNASALEGALLAAPRQLGVNDLVVFPARDDAVLTTSELRDRLPCRFRVTTPGWDTVRWAADKRNTYRLAGELAIATPRTVIPHSADDVAELDFEYPVAVKPALREPFVRVTKSKAWMANDRSELVLLLERAFRIVEPGEMMVQEFIEGAGDQQFAYCAFFKNGRAVGRMTVTRRRQHPSVFGRASTFVETVDVPELAAISDRLLEAMAYYGLVEVEYKLDRRDGRFKLLDVNPRVWGYHSLGGSAGVDFPYLLYADQNGEEPSPAVATVGVSWFRLITDVPAAVIEAIRGDLRFRTYLRSIARADTESVFERRDLRPALAELALVPYLAIKRGW